MDTFNEQIVKMRKSAGAIALQVLIWFAAIVIFAVVYYLGFLGSLFPIAAIGLFWGALKLTQKFNIEYEYILTNGDLDIDKIVNQSDRKRILTIKCAEIEAVGKYKEGMQLHGKKFVCCNPGEDNYYLIAREKDEGTVCLVFAPSEKMKKGIKTFLPRIIQLGAFDN